MFVAEFGAGPTLLIAVAVIVGLVWLARSRSSVGNRECPYCKKRMRGDATVCPHCQRESPGWELRGGVWFRQDASGGWEYLKKHGDGGSRWLKVEESAAKREP